MYAELLKELWSTSRLAITPRRLKLAISKFSTQFRGAEQHDSQELLAFLLSGLSEDLNRVQNKPYIEQPDSDDREQQARPLTAQPAAAPLPGASLQR